MSLHKLVASDGTALCYRVDDFTPPWKEPPTLILLHSAMGSSARWFSMMPKLAQHFRVIRPDLRGHGASEVPGSNQTLTMEQLVQDVVDLMDGLGCDKVIVAGNSAGGYIAQNLAIAHPDKVSELVLFGSTAGLKNTNAETWAERIGEEGLRQFLARTIAYRFEPDTDPALIAWFLDEAAKNNVPFLGQFIGLMSSADWRDKLPEIACPTCLVIPGREIAEGVRDYSVMNRIPDLHRIVVEDAAHNICDSRPDLCVDILLKFLDVRSHT
jgi:pimeloyl-ACP methyl ester carboxylesterase